MQLTYLDELLNVLFEPSAIRMVRVMKIHAGMLFPHWDMVEFGEAGRKFTRVHAMLKTTPTALHSESSDVFRMGAGDIWFLYVHGTHTAINREASPRYTMVVDLNDKFDLCSLSTRPGVRPSTPTMISRSGLT
ncbi:hypothetical protein [Paraburkholderia mimosarum]|uniref:hypothetical protein n=1 Tax=Paraburkholderia mimosarum TaxID=312026 RepID=UPI0004811C4C|nr:hypothetical protein [Paraburkholderia mimosarum]